MSVVKPHTTLLSPGQTAKVDEYARRILADTGIKADSRAARDLFAKAGCKIADDRVFIPSEVIDWAVTAAPSTIDIYDRRGNDAFRIGDVEKNPPRFGIGVTNLYYQDPQTDAVVPFSRAHMQRAVRLGNHLPGFDMVSTPGIIQDLPADTADLYAVLEMLANTTKPLILLVSEHRRFEAVLDLLEHLGGDARQKPFAMAYVNPITPLVLNTETSDKIRVAVRRGLPVIFNNYGMSGATAPITPAGTLAVLTAELLAGLVFAQLVRKGAPVILGSLPAAFDMKTMISLYTPHTMLLNLASAEMMAHYHLPHSGTSGSVSGWGPDLLASGTLWLNHLTACMGKVGLAPFVGSNFDSLAFSPTVTVYADQIIRQARLFADGFVLDDDSVALDEIAATGPGGNYLLAGLTRKLYREIDYSSDIWPGLTLEQWQAKGSPRAGDRLRTHTRNLLEDLAAPGDHDRLQARGETFIAKLLGA